MAKPAAFAAVSATPDAFATWSASRLSGAAMDARALTSVSLAAVARIDASRDTDDETLLRIADAWVRWSVRGDTEGRAAKSPRARGENDKAMASAWSDFASHAESVMAEHDVSVAALRLATSRIAVAQGDLVSAKRCIEEATQRTTAARNDAEMRWLTGLVLFGGLLDAHGDTALANEYYEKVVSEKANELPRDRNRDICLQSLRSAGTLLIRNRRDDQEALRALSGFPVYEYLLKDELSRALAAATSLR